MKRITTFSRIATIFCLIYIIFDVICLFTFVPYIFGTIFRICYYSLFGVFATLMLAKKIFKRPSIYIIIAASLGVVNACVSLYGSYLPYDSRTKTTLITGITYLPMLIFICMGFFKLAKTLPKGTWVKRMAAAIPSIELFSLVLPAVWMLVFPGGNPGFRWFIETLFVIQIIIVSLFYYALPQVLKYDNDINTQKSNSMNQVPFKSR